MSFYDSINQKSIFEAFDFSIDPIAVTDTNLKNGFKFIYVNDAFCKETGYEKNELIGNSPKILQGEKSDRHILDMLKANLQRNERFVGQTSNYKKDGTEYIVKWTISPLKNHQGDVVAYVSIHKVMTPQIKAEDENLFFNDIIQQAPGMILIVNVNKIIKYINDEYLSHLGYKREELIGQDITILESVPQDIFLYEEKWNKVYKNGTFSGVIKIMKKNSEFYYDKQNVKSIKNKDGKVQCYLILSSDITALKKAFDKKGVSSDSMNYYI